MKERPILFSGEMVKAILGGRKTQTRRIVSLLPHWKAQGLTHADLEDSGFWNASGDQWQYGDERLRQNYQVGDRLWVREAMRRAKDGCWYFADGARVTCDVKDQTAMLVWATHKEGDVCVSIHMPRWASRITLEITGVCVERLQEIDAAEVDAEGVAINHYYCDESGGAFGHRCEPIERFKELWDRINGDKAPWKSNPWVWVIQFQRKENQ